MIIVIVHDSGHDRDSDNVKIMSMLPNMRVVMVVVIKMIPIMTQNDSDNDNGS